MGLTAYDAIMSKLVSKAGVDFILVGDSVGTTLLGYDTTIPVTIDDMVHHTSAVRRGTTWLFSGRRFTIWRSESFI